jgi:hypothetical protein
MQRIDKLNKPSIIIAAILGLISLSSFPGLSNTGSVRTEKIQELGSFPSEDLAAASVLLYGSLFMDRDIHGNIYISNSKGGNIHCFNSAGDFLSTFGRKGHGPGELSYPTNIMTTDELIIVQDIGNRKIQIFDKAGKPTGSFKLFKTYEDMVLDRRKKIIYASLMLTDASKNLVDVLSFDGKMLNSFGIPLDYKFKRGTMNTSRLALMESGDLILGFAFLPIIRRYSADGRLIAERRLHYEGFITKGRENDRSYRKSLANGTNPSFHMITSALQEEQGRIYVLSCSPGITILEYDDTFSLIKAYVGLDDQEIFINDFAVDQLGGQIRFYALQVMPENIVNIFGQK